MRSSSFVSDNLKAGFLARSIRFLYMSLVSHNHTGFLAYRIRFLYMSLVSYNHTIYLSWQKTFTSAPKISLFTLLWSFGHPHILQHMICLESNLCKTT